MSKWFTNAKKRCIIYLSIIDAGQCIKCTEVFLIKMPYIGRMEDNMKNKVVSMFCKIGAKVLPMCAMLGLIINSNSTSSWIQGQPEPPKSLKKYRRF